MEDKTIINVNRYKIKDRLFINSYTATWCNPCKRIKPIVIETMDKNNYEKVNETIIKKEDFKKNINEFIPFFELVKYEIVECPDGYKGCEVLHYSSQTIDSVQTSDQTEFAKFLFRNKLGNIILDNDF